jgi:hypothetical protein
VVEAFRGSIRNEITCRVGQYTFYSLAVHRAGARGRLRLARKILEGLGLDVATPAEAREILALKGGDQVAF